VCDEGVTKASRFVHRFRGGHGGPGVGFRRVFERFTERARKVVVLAQEEARSFDHGHIGTEHILLGLLCVQDGLAARVLATTGITVDAVRGKVGQLVGDGDEASHGQIPFTPRAKKVLELSLREALAVGHNYIGTEHILLGLVRENDGVAARILLELGADSHRVHDEVLEALAGLGPIGSVPTPGRAGRWRRPRPSVAIRSCWQYRVERPETIDEQHLNELGADGWELVSVDHAAGAPELIFKRRNSQPGSLRVAG
jgi:ATP-dependent Clp protease ATP-binding subunit ClpA